MAELVSFVANTTPAPPSGNRTALKALAWALGPLTLAAVMCVAFWDASFLAGMLPNPLGQVAGVVGGILAAGGLATLLVAVGITHKEMPVVAIMAFALFVVCLWISLSAACGFAFFSTQPLREVVKAVQQFTAEPRQLAIIDRNIQRFRIEKREHWVGNQWWRATGDEILWNTRQCKDRHLSWESTQCEEWDYLQREKAERLRLDGGAEGGGFDPLEMLSPGMIAFNRYYSSGLAHLVIVLFAAVGGAIISGTAYVLMMPPLGIIPPVTTPGPNGNANAIQKTFDAWAEQCLQPAAGVTTSADLLYRHHVAFADWTKGRAHAGIETFGAAMSGPLRKLKAVRTEVGKNRDVGYVGLELRSDGLSGQILSQIGGSAPTSE